MQYTFSENLKYYRERRDMTKRELASRIHVNVCSIWRWENNIQYPRIDSVYSIAKVLGVTVSDLVGESKLIPDE